MHGTGVSTVNAFTAHREWATRPPDERFNSVQALCEAARTRRIGTEERDVETVDFGTEAVTDDIIALRDGSDRPAAQTHWSFEQLATIAGAPPKYLRTLPATIASAAINHGLRRQRREQHQPFADHAAPWTVRAITSPLDPMRLQVMGLPDAVDGAVRHADRRGQMARAPMGEPLAGRLQRLGHDLGTCACGDGRRAAERGLSSKPATLSSVKRQRSRLTCTMV